MLGTINHRIRAAKHGTPNPTAVKIISPIVLLAFMVLPGTEHPEHFFGEFTIESGFFTKKYSSPKIHRICRKNFLPMAPEKRELRHQSHYKPEPPRINIPRDCALFAAIFATLRVSRK